MNMILTALRRIAGSKTTWAALGTIAAAGGAYADHRMSLASFIQTVGGALLAACLRDTVAKNGGRQ